MYYVRYVVYIYIYRMHNVQFKTFGIRGKLASVELMLTPSLLATQVYSLITPLDQWTVEMLAVRPMGSQGIWTKVHQGHTVYFYMVHLLPPSHSIRCGNAKNLRVDRPEI